MRTHLIALSVFSLATVAQAQVEPKKNRGLMNPDVSMNALFLYKLGSNTNLNTSEEPNGLSLQEAELAIYSDVDPYTKLSTTLAIAQEASLNPTTGGFDRSYVIEPEVLYFETTAIDRLTLRGGKIKAAVGKENQIHTHAYAFVDSSMVVSSVLEGEGVNEVGLSASYLLPLPWFSELTLQALYPKNSDDDALFNSPNANSPVKVQRLRNLWDINDSTTFEVNLSAAQAKRRASDGATPAAYAHKGVDIYGADFALKWREGKERALVWNTEFLKNNYGTFVGKNQNYALSSHVLWQWAARWWLGARGEFVENKTVDSGAASFEQQKKFSAIASFSPSEFSTYRLQLDQLTGEDDEDEKRALLQFNFTIGAHPTHAY